MTKRLFLKTAFLLLGSLSFSLITSAQNCDQHQALVKKLDEAMMKKDANLLAEAYHADAKRHTSEGTQEGIAKIQESAAKFYKEVPDATGKNVDTICTDDRLVVRWTGTGTPVGAKGKVNVTGITIYAVEDGKIKEEWEEMNLMSLMMQMGYELKPPADN